MRTHFVWDDCSYLFLHGEDCNKKLWRGEPQRVFWVSANATEIESQLIPLMREEAKKALREWQSYPVDDGSDIYAKDGQRSASGENFFVIAADLSLVSPWIRVFPTSAMWGSEPPWCRYERVITRVEELSLFACRQLVNANADPQFSESYLAFAYPGG